MAPAQTIVFVARCILVTAIVHRREIDAPGLCIVTIAVRPPQTRVIVRPALDGKLTLRHRRGCATDDIDDAVQRIRAVHCRSRSTQQFDLPGLRRIDLEQLVDVAETRRPQRHAVFCHVELTATARAGKYGRTNRREVFLAVAAADPRAGRARQQFGDMHRGNFFDGGAIDHGDAAGEIGCGLLLARRRDTHRFERVRERRRTNGNREHSDQQTFSDRFILQRPHGYALLCTALVAS